MSTFKVEVTRIRAILPIPKADRIVLAQVGDYRCVVGAGIYKEGDLVAYIPVASILPDAVLERVNLKGSTLLAGKEHRRVKEVRLRGQLSEGICYPVEPDWTEGQDVAEILGIVKHVPPIPANLAGQVWNAGAGYPCFTYDFENVKKYPDVLIEGEQVVFTEKLHGTWMGTAVLPPDKADPVEGDFLVSSKGQFKLGLCFKLNEANAGNLYCRVAKHLDIKGRIQRVFGAEIAAGKEVYVFGEALGVQDGYAYGTSTASDETLGFRVFDIRVGRYDHYLGDVALDEACYALGLPRVPVLYRGPYSKAIMLQHTNGLECVSGEARHIREGLVACPVVERADPALGSRVKLKSVSEAYLDGKIKGGDDISDFE